MYLIFIWSYLYEEDGLVLGDHPLTGGSVLEQDISLCLTPLCPSCSKAAENVIVLTYKVSH